MFYINVYTKKPVIHHFPTDFPMKSFPETGPVAIGTGTAARQERSAALQPSDAWIVANRMDQLPEFFCKAQHV